MHNEENMKADPVDGSFTCFIIVFRFDSHRCLDYYTKKSLE